MPLHVKAAAYILRRQRGNSIYWIAFLLAAPYFQPELRRSPSFLPCFAVVTLACVACEFLAWRYWKRPADVPRHFREISTVIALGRNGGLGVAAGHHYALHGLQEVDLVSATMIMGFAVGATVVVRPYWPTLLAALLGLSVPVILGALACQTAAGTALAICLTGGMTHILRLARTDHLEYWKGLNDSRSLEIARRQAQANAKAEGILLASQTKQNAIHAERNRIAADWHDSLLASLSAANLLLETLQRRQERSAEENRQFQDVLDGLRHCRAEARLAIADLLSVTEHDANLPRLLEENLEPMARHGEAQLTIRLVGTPWVSHSFPAQEVLRILQEALVNAMRHGKARSIAVTMEYADDALELTLADDGQGFDPQAARPNSFGLAIMRQRAQRLGATLSIQSSPGKGAAVVLRIANRKAMQTRVLLIEDHFLARLAMQTLLASEPAFQLVGEAQDFDQGLALFRELRPNVTILDLRIPGGTGLQLLRQIRQIDSAARVLVISNLDGSENIASALAEGALGYVLKDSSAAELLAALQAVARGGQYLSKSANYALNQRNFQETLTPREIDVLELLVKGLGNKAIGDKLGIAEKTVRAHMTGILAKLQASDRTQAALIAVRQGFVEDPNPPAVG